MRMSRTLAVALLAGAIAPVAMAQTRNFTSNGTTISTIGDFGSLNGNANQTVPVPALGNRDQLFYTNWYFRYNGGGTRVIASLSTPTFTQNAVNEGTWNFGNIGTGAGGPINATLNFKYDGLGVSAGRTVQTLTVSNPSATNTISGAFFSVIGYSLGDSNAANDTIAAVGFGNGSNGSYFRQDDSLASGTGFYAEINGLTNNAWQCGRVSTSSGGLISSGNGFPTSSGGTGSTVLNLSNNGSPTTGGSPLDAGVALQYNFNLGPGQSTSFRNIFALNAAAVVGGCNPADIAGSGATYTNGTVDVGADQQLGIDDFIIFLAAFSDATGCPGVAPCNPADIAGSGATYSNGTVDVGPDGDLGIDDFIVFLAAFSDGTGCQ